MKMSEAKRLARNEAQRRYRKSVKGQKYYRKYHKNYYLNVATKQNNNKRILKNIKHRAKLRNLEFNLDIEDIVIPEYCPILGLKLDRNGPNDFLPSVDRIDNTKGYIKGNIIVISGRANRIKSDASLKELYDLVNFYNNLLRDDK